MDKTLMKKDFSHWGFNGKQPHTANVYTNNGSLYLASLAFLPLGLSADHPFGLPPSESWTSKRLGKEKNFLKIIHIMKNTQ